MKQLFISSVFFCHSVLWLLSFSSIFNELLWQTRGCLLPSSPIIKHLNIFKNKCVLFSPRVPSRSSLCIFCIQVFIPSSFHHFYCICLFVISSFYLSYLYMTCHFSFFSFNHHFLQNSLLK